MEAQDLPLETLLARYAEGAKLTRLCQAKLNEAELKIQQLEKEPKGELTLKPAPCRSKTYEPLSGHGGPSFARQKTDAGTIATIGRGNPRTT